MLSITEKLFSAIESNNVSKVSRLLDEGADVNSVDANNISALQWAAVKGAEDSLNLLISAGALIAYQDNQGQTALDLAAANNHISIMKKLFRAAKTQDVQFSVGMGLNLACINQHDEAVEMLLKKSRKGHNLLEIDAFEALHHAVRLGNLKSTKLILSYYPALINRRDENRETFLHHACDAEHVDMIDMLVGHGAKPHFKNNGGSTPFHSVAEKGNNQYLTMFLERFGTGLANIMDNYGQSPLHFAAMNGHVQTVQYLVAAGSNPNAIDNTGSTPLHFAVENGHKSTVNYLLSVDARTDLSDYQGMSLLHLAAQENHSDIAAELIKFDPELLFKLNVKGKSPKEVAQEYGHECMGELIENAINSHGRSKPRSLTNQINSKKRSWDLISDHFNIENVFLPIEEVTTIPLIFQQNPSNQKVEQNLFRVCKLKRA